MKVFKKNIIFFAIYLCFWLADALLIPYLGLFFAEKGLSGGQIAILSMVESIVPPVSAVLLGLIMSTVKNRTGFFVALPVGCAAAAAAMYYIGPFGGMIVATVVLYFCRTPYNGLVDRVLMACIHDTPGEYGKFRLGGSVGYGIGALIAGTVYSAYACRPLFFMYIPAIVATGLLCLKAPINITQDYSAVRPKLSTLLNFKVLKSRGGFFKIYGTLALFGFITATAGKFMAMYVAEQGLESTITGMLIAFAMIGEIIMFLSFPAMSKKLSPEAEFFLGFLVYLVRNISFYFIASLPMWLVMIMQIVGGAEFSIMWAAATQLVESNYPPEAGFIAQTLKSVFNSSIGYGLGCIMLSWFYDLGSIKSGYGVLLAINGACVLVYGFLACKERRVNEC